MGWQLEEQESLDQKHQEHKSEMVNMEEVRQEKAIRIRYVCDEVTQHFESAKVESQQSTFSYTPTINILHRIISAKEEAQTKMGWQLEEQESLDQKHCIQELKMVNI